MLAQENKSTLDLKYCEHKFINEINGMNESISKMKFE